LVSSIISRIVSGSHDELLDDAGGDPADTSGFAPVVAEANSSI
jgi:hypothetical protein